MGSRDERKVLEIWRLSPFCTSIWSGVDYIPEVLEKGSNSLCFSLQIQTFDSVHSFVDS